MAAMTKLQAINEMLEALGLKPVAALDTGGSSDAGHAERVLDRESQRVQMAGFYGNTVKSKAYTAASNVVALASTVLSIKAAGPSGYRNFDVRGTSGSLQVYDLDNDTFTITTGTVIYLDVISEIPFADCPHYIQACIMGYAKQLFARRFKTNTPEIDAMFAEERVRLENNANRSSGRAVEDRNNPPPFAMGSGKGQG